MSTMNIHEMIKEINKIRFELQRRADLCFSNSCRALSEGNESFARKLTYHSEIYNAADNRLLFAVEFLQMLLVKDENDVL